MLKELLIASHNQNKISEFKKMLAPYGVAIYSADDFNLPDIEETGTTFAENAALKADASAKLTGKPCLADDSGLCVTALNNAPGIYSARYAPNHDFNLGIAKLLEELNATKSPDRSAHFSCVLALKIPNREIQFFEGRVNGTITFKPRGNNGFGYDPIFMPDGYSKTFAEMTNLEKSQISHRGRALKLFLENILNVTNI